MPYRGSNYDFVIDSSFRPFTFQEMLAPLAIYKDAYEKAEEAYNDLIKRADVFSNLAEELKDNPNSRAANIYKQYADELHAKAADLATNGLTINNRGALTKLKQRYEGEIGLLDRANEKLKEIQKGRNALAAAGKTMLYADDNPTLDSLLDDTSFNRYSIDAAELRNRGNALGKAISSRVYSNDEAGSILQNQYKIWKQVHGISPASIAGFMQSDAVRSVVANELIANGAASNLSGRNLATAEQNILNGIYEGIVYEESAKPLENGEYMSARERSAEARANRSQLVSEAMNGITWENGRPVYNENNDISRQRAVSIEEAKAAARNAGKTSGGRTGAAYDVRNKETIMVGATSGDAYRHKEDKTSMGKPLESLDGARKLTPQEEINILDGSNPNIRQAIGGVENIGDYEIWVIPANSTKIDGTGVFRDDNLGEDVYIIKPRESKRAATDTNVPSFYGDTGTNDIHE